jgi:hypothetical protein
VDGLDLTGFGGQTERLGRNLQEFGGLAEIEPGLDAVLCRLEHRDPVVRPQGGDALAGPAVAVARLEAVAVEQTCDQIIAGDEHQSAHRVKDVGGRAVALSAPALWQPHLAVCATDPMHDNHDLGRFVIDIGDDLVDQRADDTLLQARIGGWR